MNKIKFEQIIKFNHIFILLKYEKRFITGFKNILLHGFIYILNYITIRIK